MFDARPRSTIVTALTTAELEEELACLAAEIAAGTCRFLELAAEFERRDGHLEAGFHRCSAWLAYRCSLDLRTAREHMRVARRLGELPKVREAFASGELSYSKVRTIARVARTPAMEEQLLEMARCATAGQLARIASACAGALTREQSDKQYANRHFSFHWDDDGSLAFSGRLAGDEGALLIKALRAGCSALRKEEGLDPDRHDPYSPASPSNADALIAMAEALLASGPVTREATERSRVVVHVDREVLAEGGCQLEDGPPVSAETARRLSCDAPATITGEGGSAAPSRSRAIPSAVRRAVRVRDGGCRFPGCENRHWVDAHHIVHWAHGGDSTSENLIQLCRRHHRLVHEGGFTIEQTGEGALRFRHPNGSRLLVSPPLPRVRERGSHRGGSGGGGSGGRGSPASARRPHLRMPEPLDPGPFDLGLAVEGLCRAAGPDP